MGVQLGWKVDVNACISCRACEMACKVEYDLKAGQGRRRRVIEKTVEDGSAVRTFFLSLACNHCANPACIAACPKSEAVNVGTSSDSALWKDEFGTSSGGVVGVVRVESSICIGCRRCEWACPYGAPQFNPESGKIHKCEMCWERISSTTLHETRRRGACVATCIGQSIKQDVIDTDPTATYDFTPTDRCDLSAVDENVGSHGAEGDFGNHIVYSGTGLFASPGTTLGHSAGRGTDYVADAAMTNPGLKIRNRVYVNSDGKGVS